MCYHRNPITLNTIIINTSVCPNAPASVAGIPGSQWSVCRSNALTVNHMVGTRGGDGYEAGTVCIPNVVYAYRCCKCGNTKLGLIFIRLLITKPLGLEAGITCDAETCIVTHFSLLDPWDNQYLHVGNTINAVPETMNYAAANLTNMVLIVMHIF